MDSPTSVTIGNIDSSSRSVLSTSPTMMAATEKMSGGFSEDDIVDCISHPRTLIFQLGVLVGNLCSAFLQKMPLDPPVQDPPETADGYALSPVREEVDAEVAVAMARILCLLLQISHSLSLSMETSIYRKMELNNKKYPVDLCKGKAGKYTEYSDRTGITKLQGQSMMGHHPQHAEGTETLSSFLEAIDALTMEIRAFATDRQWARYHKPRNLVLALMGELGELAELFQWRGDAADLDSISKEDLDKMSQELADVCIYLLRLADITNVDLQACAAPLLAERDY